MKENKNIRKQIEFAQKKLYYKSKGLDIIRECYYAGWQHAVPPTNTKFKLLLLPIQAGIRYTNNYKHRTSYFKSALTFQGQAKRWKSISAARQNLEILAIFHHVIIRISKQAKRVSIYRWCSMEIRDIYIRECGSTLYVGLMGTFSKLQSIFEGLY